VGAGSALRHPNPEKAADLHILTQRLRTAAVGVSIGVAASLWATRYPQPLLFDVDPATSPCSPR